MQTLEFTIDIDAPVRQVWDTMLDPDTYRQWTAVAWPDSHFEGEWKAGREMRFVGSDGSGTVARLTRVQPYAAIKSEHIAMLGPGGEMISTGETAQSWIGTTENYYFQETNGRTRLRVVIGTVPQYAGMFNEGWPLALDKLRTLSE